MISFTGNGGTFHSDRKSAKIPNMKLASLPKPHEQRKVEKLLIRLTSLKPVSAKPAYTVAAVNAMKSA